MRLAFFVLALFVCNAGAATYGDTAYNYSAQATGCTDLVALSLPMSVSVSSRVHVSARTTYNPSGTNLTLGVTYVELRDSGDTTTLATSQWGWGGGTINSFVQSDGLLHSGSSVNDPSSAIYTASPGNYLLKMHVYGSNGTCTGNPVFTQPTLTYILLSAAFDRIFADGFEAMLNDVSTVSQVA